MSLVSSVATVLAFSTIVAQVLIVLGFISYFFPKKIKPLDKLFSNYIVPFAFIVPVLATIGSLFYSEIARFEPCLLCWYQRIFMYPLAFIMTIGYFLKDKKAAIYAIVLSAIGAVIALYHYLLQIGTVGQILPCSAVGYSASCSQRFSLEFGYITIPMMALSAFLLIIVLSLHQLRLSSGKK